MTISRLHNSDVDVQLAEQDTADLHLFARIIALGIVSFSLLTTCGITLAMQLDHHQQMELRRAENERLIILESKCLGK